LRSLNLSVQMDSNHQNCRSKKPISNFSNCNSKKVDTRNSTLATMIAEYLKECENCYQEEDKWWGDKTITWSKAVERAWRSRFENGQMHGHQRRVAHKLEEGLKISLSDNIPSSRFSDFHSIYQWVKSVTDRVSGLGTTTAYDVARRLGIWVGFQPTMVYLHAGAFEGAKKLGIEGETISLNDFPREIQKLGATHAENFLCIYKNLLS
jgi:hypothetical protein